MRWLGKYMIWLMAVIGFIHAIESWPIPVLAKMFLCVFTILAWLVWDQNDKPSKKGEN